MESLPKKIVFLLCHSRRENAIPLWKALAKWGKSEYDREKAKEAAT